MVAKTHSAKFLAMIKKLLVVWMVAKFLVCQWFFAHFAPFFPNVGQLMGNQNLNQVLASQIFGTEPNMPDIMSD
jgi:hypothetical protein